MLNDGEKVVPHRFYGKSYMFWSLVLWFKSDRFGMSDPSFEQIEKLLVQSKFSNPQ